MSLFDASLPNLIFYAIATLGILFALVETILDVYREWRYRMEWEARDSEEDWE